MHATLIYESKGYKNTSLLILATVRSRDKFWGIVCCMCDICDRCLLSADISTCQDLSTCLHQFVDLSQM